MAKALLCPDDLIQVAQCYVFLLFILCASCNNFLLALQSSCMHQCSRCKTYEGRPQVSIITCFTGSGCSPFVMYSALAYTHKAWHSTVLRAPGGVGKGIPHIAQTSKYIQPSDQTLIGLYRYQGEAPSVTCMLINCPLTGHLYISHSIEKSQMEALVTAQLRVPFRLIS